MRLALVCFYCLCVFVYVLYFIATMSFAGYLLSVLLCLLSMLISDSRFDLVWFRLSCDHGWIRSGSVNVRKQQQQQQHRLASPALQILPRGDRQPWRREAQPFVCPARVDGHPPPGNSYAGMAHAGSAGDRRHFFVHSSAQNTCMHQSHGPKFTPPQLGIPLRHDST